MKAVIIGNSVAGVAGATGFRSADADSEILMISSEPYRAYSRPLITYYLAGKVGEQQMYYCPEDFYERRNIQTKFGAAAASIDTQARQVVLADGDSVGYDRLLIATGGAPYVPRIEGLDGTKYCTFTTWDDARQVQELLPNVRNAVVLGGGLIGLKVAEALNTLHVRTTMIELADRILSPALDTRASAMIKRALEETGIDVRTGDTIASVEAQGTEVTRVNLRSGISLAADLLVVAVGVVPNVAVTAGSGIAVNRGIIIDDHCATSAAGVYAAGDVAEGADMLLGSPRVIPIWPAAYYQGRTAGLNMAGEDAVCPGIFGMNSVEVGGTCVVSVGLSTAEEGGEYEVMVSPDERANTYRKIVLKGDVIAGAIFVNTIDRSGIITGLIRDRVDVRHFKDALRRNDFGYISLPRKLRKSRLQTLGVKQ